MTRNDGTPVIYIYGSQPEVLDKDYKELLPLGMLTLDGPSFRVMKDPYTFRTYDPVFMNTSTGIHKGMHLKTEWALKGGTDENNLDSEILHFAHFGNVGDWEGILGSLIWDSKFEVVGQCHSVGTDAA